MASVRGCGRAINTFQHVGENLYKPLHAQNTHGSMYRPCTLTRIFAVVVGMATVLYMGIGMFTASVRRRRNIRLDAVRASEAILSKTQYTRNAFDMTKQLSKQDSTAFVATPNESQYTKKVNKNELESNMCVMVMSARGDFDRREAIRDTWARDMKNVWFMVGEEACGIPPNNRKSPYGCSKKEDRPIDTNYRKGLEGEQEMLMREIKRYKNLVLLPMVDYYQALPHKLKLGYDWCLKHTNAQWFVKIDDDAYMRGARLEEELKGLDHTQNILAGTIRRGIGVPRSGKWKEFDFYKKEKYPPFANGAQGHVVTRRVARKIVELDGQELQGEDVSLGEWIDQLHLPDMKILHRPDLFTLGNCMDKRKVVVGHNISPTYMKQCWMITQPKVYGTLIGRLGNQLFQWASLQGIASKNGMSTCVGVGDAFQGSSIFSVFTTIPNACSVKKSNIPHVGEVGEYATYRDLHFENSVVIEGYLQSYKYFPPDLYDRLKFKEAIVTKAKAQIVKGKKNIGIHVRHRHQVEVDYLRFPPNDYFENVMSQFRRDYPNAFFYVASDDVAWCKQQSFFQKSDVKIIENDPGLDMAVLASCDHMVLTVGTFGWWAAFLGAHRNGGKVIYYEKEFLMEHEVNKGNVVKEDYYPKEWITGSEYFVTNPHKYHSTECKNPGMIPAGFNGDTPGNGHHNHGSYSNEYLYKIQVCQYDALNIFWKIATRYQITRWMSIAGTVIGTRCFSSMNPWDDDIDITIAKKDRDKFYTFWNSLAPTKDFYHDQNWVQRYMKGNEYVVYKYQYRDWFKIRYARIHEQIPKLSDLSGIDVFIEDTKTAEMEKKLSGYTDYIEGTQPIKKHAFGPVFINQPPKEIADKYTSYKHWNCDLKQEMSFHNTIKNNNVDNSEIEPVLKGKSVNNGKLIKKYETYQSTIVTAYFDIPSKHRKAEYLNWMQNILSLKDAMVIFTTIDMVPTVKNLRFNASDKTVVVPMDINSIFAAKLKHQSFWENQLAMDPEKKLHKSYQLFWIWLSKSWFVTETIQKNPFNSEIFVWMDIGSFRINEYNNKKLILHEEIIPKTAMLLMARSTPKITKNMFVQKNKDNVWVSGAHMAGRIDVWGRFHDAFCNTIQGYVDQNLFVGEDQAVIQSTCQQHPTLCSFVTPDMVKGSVWFGLRDVLHQKGNIFFSDSALLFWLPLRRASTSLVSDRPGVLCTLVKDEPDYVIWRWVTHHKNLGFNVIIYDHYSSHRPEWGIVHTVGTNCCTDDSEKCRLCRQCAEYDSSKNKKEHGFTLCQRVAYADCKHRYGHQHEWIGNWDVDEYIFPFPQKSKHDVSRELFHQNVWEVISQYDSVQLQCLKFGPRRADSEFQYGDPAAYQWRAPYEHLGDVSNCTKDVCESIGSEKMLSRTQNVISISPHVHKLTKASNVLQWKNVKGLRCHHYVARSIEHAHLKSRRNHNTFIEKQLKSGTHDDKGWFNTIHDTSFSTIYHPPDICVAFLSCKRLSKLIHTYEGINRLIESVPFLRFTKVIVDNGSSEETKKWITSSNFDKSILLKNNIGLAEGMDILWDTCGDARFILNVEDDWVLNENSHKGVIRESVRILGKHRNVLEVWLRSHHEGFQYNVKSFVSTNGKMTREAIIADKPFSYYLQQSTKNKYPWWGSYTNGASFKHAARLRSIGNVLQRECGDARNCESEFASKVAYLGWKSARLCWRNDSCWTTSDNEPQKKVLFIHQRGARSPGHYEQSKILIENKR